MTRKRMKWENDDYICCGHILNDMSDSLFDIYQNAESAKALWESLESKYMVEDASAKKFLVSNFMNYKMVDTRAVMEQYHEMLRILGQYTQHNLMIDEAIHLRIEEGLRNQELDNNPKGKNQIGSFSVNTVEGDEAKNSNNNKNKRKFKSGDDKFANKKAIDFDNVLHYVSIISDAFYVQDDEVAAVVRLTKPKMKNMGEKGIDCIFIGYVEHSKCYRFYVIEPNDYVSVNSIIESRDAMFDEERFTSIPRPRGMIQPSSSKIAEDEVEGTDDVPGPSVPRKSTRTRKAKSFGSDFQLYLVEGTRDKTLSQREYCFIIEEDPRTLSEAMASRDVAFWKEAVQSEIDSIMHNDTWELTDLPPGCKALGCKWILKRKMKVDGSIDKYKARLVIQGFRQKEGIDFFDTYAPVARISTIRLLLALAAIHDLVIHQMDVKTAFLNGDLDEEIYMKQPEGFVIPGHESKVCKLKKSLYGLKQAPKQWHQKFDDVVLSNGFSLNQTDKYLEKAEVILGIRIKRGNNGISISQSHYIEKILTKFNFANCSPVYTPVDPTVKFRPNKGTPVSQLEYSRAIGCLMYAMISTRPDIAFAVGKLSRYTSNPSALHWQALGRVFQYLKGTMDYGLTYSGYPSVIEGYSDASWINNMEDHSSTSGWVFLLGGGAISWASKKQTCITSSTMESEFVALAAAGNEAEWLRNLVYEIPLGLNRCLPFLSDVIVLLPWLRLIVKCTMASLDT
ncbi:zinc finger, CCHC-type containing protein [Tanacetum coccineum]